MEIKTITAKNIFIAAGTKPLVLPVEGLDTIDILTNENIFKLEKVPESMAVWGGGAIACEMAQAFQRLGANVTIIQRSPQILSKMDAQAAELLKAALEKEGVNVITGVKPVKFKKIDDGVEVELDNGENNFFCKVISCFGAKEGLFVYEFGGGRSCTFGSRY